MPGTVNVESSDELPPRVESRVEPHVESHVDIAPNGDHSAPTDDHSSHHHLTDSNGWDGKLRIDRNASIHNPEALSDPEYSDEDNVLPGEEISPDEGMFLRLR